MGSQQIYIAVGIKLILSLTRGLISVIAAISQINGLQAEEPSKDEEGFIILKTERPITNKLTACLPTCDRFISAGIYLMKFKMYR